ncbi:hypothetical protein BDZ91DRAFT_783245 [Kalaharituber pfeilii]|nr:hypothetical protein BDZ91DRAFT_783245 [Kalaharituber pfeilii]
MAFSYQQEEYSGESAPAEYHPSHAKILKDPTPSLMGSEFWQDVRCEHFGANEIVDEMIHSLGGYSNCVSHDEMLQDTHCAICNGFDLGMLYAVARAKWLVKLCRRCNIRPEIGNASWKAARCIARQWDQNRQKWHCDCLHAATVGQFRLSGTQKPYKPQIHQDTILHATAVPPRRLWDIKANRVISFYGTVSKLCQWCFHNICTSTSIAGTHGSTSMMQGEVFQDRNLLCFEQEYWAISHSWTKDMVPMDTPINSYQWPAPIPACADLEGVRHEARLCGAEYCWLDVLCLRQRKMDDSHQVSDNLRLEEWQVDVPTIGNIYRNATGVLRYFNGLGRRFVCSTEIWSDRRHWANRAWTLQEMRPEEEMVNAGVIVGSRLSLSTPLSTSGEHITLRMMLKPLSELALAIHSPSGCSIIELARHMSKRFATNPVDKIAGINYLIWPKGWTFDLPIYNPATHMEDAWLRCVRSMRRDLKVELLFLFPHPREHLTNHTTSVNSSWIPTWSQIADFAGDVWTDLPLRVISENVYTSALNPLIVPTLLWGLRDPLGTLVFDECTISVVSDNTYKIILGLKGLRQKFNSFQFYSTYPVPQDSLSSKKCVLLCLSLQVTLPWVLCVPRSTISPHEVPPSENISNYRRFLLLEKQGLMRTEERLLIAQTFSWSLPLRPRSYDAVVVV